MNTESKVNNIKITLFRKDGSIVRSMVITCVMPPDMIVESRIRQGNHRPTGMGAMLTRKTYFIPNTNTLLEGFMQHGHGLEYYEPTNVVQLDDLKGVDDASNTVDLTAMDAHNETIVVEAWRASFASAADQRAVMALEEEAYQLFSAGDMSRYVYRCIRELSWQRFEELSGDPKQDANIS